MATTTFEYKVRDRTGNLVEGQLDGDSVPLVVTKLREMGYLPIVVTPKVQGRVTMKGLLSKEMGIPILSRRVKLKEIAVMTRQFATMVESGLSVVRALAILAGETENKELARVLREVRLDVETGSSLSGAAAKHPRVFSNLYVTMLEAGEAGGTIDMVLASLASTLERQAALNRKILSAMVYPIVVVTIVGSIFLAMLAFVVPIFQKLFTSLHGQLPLPTRIVIGIAHAVISLYALAIIAGIVVAILLFRKWIDTESGREHWDRFKLRPPVFGELAHKVALVRFTSTFSSLLTAGVPILQSLDIVSSTSGNKIVSNAIQDAKQHVRQGTSLAEPLSRHEVIPPLIIQMIEVGEQTGALDVLLQRTADFYNGEVDVMVDTLTSLLEPFLILFIGAGVGAMIISMYLPMFDYIKLVPTH
ncbi:MAG: type II secretion system F family protein [Acidimicrobiales bacterium]